ncbi:MAG: efflux RND transporter periplasmic adaptor subunit [Desulfobaccales bacterium]
MKYWIEKWKRLGKRRQLLSLVGLIVILLLLGHWLEGGGRSAVFTTVPVRRGDLLATISATGTVEPEQVIDIGAQVEGIILSFGRDANGKLVDYGSVVKKNEVLAHIDDTLYVAAVVIDKAALAQARANLVNAKANVLQMQAKLWEADADWNRAQKLGPSQALAATTYDQYKAAYLVAKANVALALASVEQAAAAVTQAVATLKKDQETLAYCVITSPVDGVIVDRRVNIGQTIVSSTTTPSLFLIAVNLKRIQVWASVNEADIGNIHPDQQVTFTVDAFGDQVFHGVVGKVRLNATMSQNVVTYTVEVNCDNSDGKLLPYLTTNLQFEVGHRRNVLLVPNAALRWAPRGGRKGLASAGAPEAAAGGSGNAEGRARGSGASAARGTVWVPHGDSVRPIHVRIGLTDGVWTEVTGKDVTEGLPVVVAEGKQEAAGSPSAGASPFIPQFHFGGHGGGH